MVTSAKLKYIRVTPRKFRLIIPLIKGKNPEAAIAILAGVKKNAARYCEDLLKSALANAKRIQGLDMSSLYISKLVADGGPMLKRFRAASMGRASMIKKRTSHITLELDRLEPKKEHPKPKTKVNVEVKKIQTPPVKKTVKKGKE
ncbi:MAG: 50S ribosomal protein L22 [Candidatus Omnitrophica bacterium]|nr:50S ribosomal protein L22 [Candidatus Omnitrophota bacterium]